MTNGKSTLAQWVYDGGGSTRSGDGDCVLRAISIAAEIPYQRVLRQLAALQDPRLPPVWDRVFAEYSDKYLAGLGWGFVKLQRSPESLLVGLKDLPLGRLIVAATPNRWGLTGGHYLALIDRVIHDTFDPTKKTKGKIWVKGYWKKEVARRERQ